MYGLSNFILGYYSNLMWLDCLMFLPLLAWCIEELVSRGHWRKYTLVLGYCIISNYYMGFILCIFSLLYYAAVYIGAEKRKDPLWRSGIKFAGGFSFKRRRRCGYPDPGSFCSVGNDSGKAGRLFPHGEYLRKSMGAA